MKETCCYYVCCFVYWLLGFFFPMSCVKLGNSLSPVFNTNAFVYIKQICLSVECTGNIFVINRNNKVILMLEIKENWQNVET